MPAADEIMTPVSTPQAVTMAEIHALRGLADAVSSQTKTFADAMGANTRVLERLSEKVDGINTRLVRLEEAKHGREIEAVKTKLDAVDARVNTLESIQDRQAGALSVGAWISKNAPWLITALVTGIAVLGWVQTLGGSIGPGPGL